MQWNPQPSARAWRRGVADDLDAAAAPGPDRVVRRRRSPGPAGPSAGSSRSAPTTARAALTTPLRARRRAPQLVPGAQRLGKLGRVGDAGGVEQRLPGADQGLQPAQPSDGRAGRARTAHRTAAAPGRRSMSTRPPSAARTGRGARRARIAGPASRSARPARDRGAAGEKPVVRQCGVAISAAWSIGAGRCTVTPRLRRKSARPSRSCCASSSSRGGSAPVRTAASSPASRSGYRFSHVDRASGGSRAPIAVPTTTSSSGLYSSWEHAPTGRRAVENPVDGAVEGGCGVAGRNRGRGIGGEGRGRRARIKS